MRARALVSLSALVLLSACGGNNGPEVSVTPLSEVGQSGSAAPSASTSAPAAASDQSGSAKAYFTALVTNDPDTDTDALSSAAKGSLAYAYLQHIANIDNADSDSGNSSDADDLTEDNGVYGYCPGGDTESKDCVKWADVAFSGGKVAEFTVNGKSLDGRVALGNGDTLKASGFAKVTFLSSYQSIQSNAVFVALKVQTGDRKVTIATYDATYRGPDGRQSKAYLGGGPSDIDKNSSAYVYANFKRAKPGGTMKVDVLDAKTFEGPTLSIKTR